MVEKITKENYNSIDNQFLINKACEYIESNPMLQTSNAQRIYRLLDKYWEGSIALQEEAMNNEETKNNLEIILNGKDTLIDLGLIELNCFLEQYQDMSWVV